MRGAIARLFAALVIYAILAQPNHPDALTAGLLLTFPLEWVLIVGLLSLAPAPAIGTKLLRAVIALALTLVFILKTADLATFTAFNRPFNPLLDLPLAEAGIRLAAGSVGWPLAIALGAGIALLPLLVLAMLWWATGTLAGLAQGTRLRSLAAVLMGVCGLLIVADMAQAPIPLPGGAFSTRLVADRFGTFGQLYADLAEFEQAAKLEPYPDASGLFDRLDGRDAFFVFVESYGQTALRNPLYAPTHLARLEQAQDQLAQAGLSMRSAWLTSPISGGQSWLAHATVASGLIIDNQARYRAMLASNRASLYHLAQRAGYRTATIMPAITLPWPEARFMGFSDIYEAADLGYAGAAFNWTTMPDQYTLSVVDRLIPDDDQPDLAMTALLSSHAPWTPVPRMVGWDSVGDGAIFDDSQHDGPPGGDVWANRDLMREQYRLALDYSLQVVFDFAARHAGRDWLLVILGDHQPAQSVAQMDSQDVPIHIVGSPELLALFDDWNFTPGLVPAPDAPVWPMSAFRERFIAAVSTP